MEHSSNSSKRNNILDPVSLYNYTYASYDKLYREEQFLKYKYVIIDRGILPKGNILDLGCGTGLLLDFLKKNKLKYEKIICLEPSEKMLELAVQKAGNDPRIIFIQGYAEDLPFKDEVFDVVYMFTVWDNIIDKEKAFKE
ncbi:MAG: class I SAM-dependent methyltransferase, partial [Staphylothermus sp.]|nr:class I SAM-dependent methyltransferase [Staphylothermus sp.]